MITGKPITNGMLVLGLVVGIAALPVSTRAQVTTSTGTPVAAFEFKGSADQTGDVTHSAGLQMTGWTAGWANLNGNVSTEESAASNGYTFRWNVGGVAQTWGWNGGTAPPVRDRYSYVTNPARYIAPVPWRIEGLTAGTSYDIIFYGTARAVPDPSTALFAIPGFDAGNGVGSAVTLDTEGDGNFQGVSADVSGYISGTFDGTTAGEARCCGVQVAELTGGGPAGDPGTLIYGK